MSHEVEKMFYTSNEGNGRFVPWHGLGTPVKNALTANEALVTAGLDWNVIQKPIFTNDREVEGYKANIRDTDNSVLGIVSNKYRIVQNTEAFSWTEALLGKGTEYETAGSLKKGRTVWLLAKLPQQLILGDEVDPFLVFTNSHDGTGAVRVAVTPIRVVCNNTLNLALSKATRAWATNHVGDMLSKLKEAERALFLSEKYMTALSEEADILANTKISEDEMNKVLDEIFVLDSDATERQKKRVESVKEEIMICTLAPDIAKYMGTKYGFINAISDWAGHSEPARKTQNYQENNWGRIIYGHPVLDKAYALIKG